MRGQGTPAEYGTSANASRTLSSAGFGERSARVRPNAQSPTSWPCRYHSSVQEKTNTPAHPAANAVRTCQSSDRVWPPSPLRQLSSPSSLMISGRSPAMFCRRSEERRVGKSVDLGGRRIIKKKKKSKGGRPVRRRHPNAVQHHSDRRRDQ